MITARNLQLIYLGLAVATSLYADYLLSKTSYRRKHILFFFVFNGRSLSHLTASEWLTQLALEVLTVIFALTAISLNPQIDTVSTLAPAQSPPSAAITVRKHISTTAEAQQEALKLYPALGVAGSRFNREFVARYKKYQQARPEYFQNTGWPLTLAREVAATLNSQ